MTLHHKVEFTWVFDEARFNDMCDWCEQQFDDDTDEVIWDVMPEPTRLGHLVTECFLFRDEDDAALFKLFWC